MSQTKDELKALDRVRSDLQLPTADDETLINKLGAMALLHSFVADAERLSLRELEALPAYERLVLGRRLQSEHLARQRAMIGAIRVTLIQIVKPEYADGAGIDRLLETQVRRALYEQQFHAATRCFRFMGKSCVEFARVPRWFRVELFIAVNRELLCGKEAEDLAREDFDRDIAAIVEDPDVQVAFRTDGPKRAASAFLEKATGVRERTGRRYLAEARAQRQVHPPRVART